MFKEITRGKQKVQNTSIKYIYIYIYLTSCILTKIIQTK